jgi:hypothetical protein
MAEVQIPNLPDVTGEYTKDQQLRDLLIAMKTTLEILTGTSENSNDSLIDYLNDNQ